MPPNAASDGPVDHGVDGREVAHVSLDGDRLAPAVADALRHGLGAVDVEVGHGNASALLGGLFGGGAPHASGCPGHQQGLPFQLHIVPSPGC